MLVTRENFSEVMSQVSDWPEIALDTETTGIRPYLGHRPFSLQMSDGKTAYYFPILAASGIDGEQVLGDKEKSEMRAFFAKTPRTWILQNAKFDLHHLHVAGFHPHEKSTFYDTAVLAILYDSSLISYSMASLARLYLQAEQKSDAAMDYAKAHKLIVDDPGDIREGKKDKLVGYEKIPLEIMLPYAEQDVIVTFALYKRLMDLLTGRDKAREIRHTSAIPLIANEAKLVYTTWQMENNGIRIDRAYVKQGLEYAKDKISDGEKRFKEITGEDYVASSQKFIEILAARGISPDTFAETSKGNLQCDRKALERIGGEVALCILDIKDNKTRSNYFTTFLRFADSSDRIHTDFKQYGTVTGRFCVAKGTFIECARDVSKYPHGKKIEDIKPGDLVYCYDNDRNLTLRKVKHVWATGEKRCVEIKWQGQGRRKNGKLVVTPDHKIRLRTGEYVRADALKKGDSLLAMGRSKTLGYGRIHTRDKEIREHCLIYNAVHGPGEGHIHHINHNKLDNRIENLSRLSGEEHIRYHSAILSNTPERKKISSSQMKRLWAEGKVNISRGEANPNFKSFSRFNVLRMLATAKGRPTCVPLDFDTFKEKCALVGVDIGSVRRRYSPNGEFISRARFKKSLCTKYPQNYRSLGVGFYRYKRLCTDMGFEEWNHRVLSVTPISPEIPTYDIEVEEFPNFIANEICVHNSSADPNLQNLKKADEDDPEDLDPFPVRRAFIPDDDCILVMADFQAMEYRMMLDYTKQYDLIEKVKAGLDLHQSTADLVGISRKHAKTLNFAILFGAGAGKIAGMMGITETEARDLIKKYYLGLPYVEKFIGEVKAAAKTRGYVTNWFGRRISYPDLNETFKAVNHIIQGGCADVMRIAMNRCHDLLDCTQSQMNLTIHDELVFNIHRSELDLIPQLADIMVKAYPYRRMPHGVEVSYSEKSLQDKIKGLPK